MSLVSKADPKLKTLYLGLLSWHFDRKSDAELSELVQQYLDSQNDQPHLHLLSDASLSDEAFESLLSHTCELLSAREENASEQPKPSSDSLQLGGRPVAAIDDFDEDEDELVRARQTLPEPDRSGIDWVAVYYSLDGLIARFSLGWLSIGRVIGLTCVAAVVGMPFYLKQEQPMSWQQIVQLLSGEPPAPKPGNIESASTPEATQFESATAIESPPVPPSIAAVDKLVESSLSRTSDDSPPLDELIIAAPETDELANDGPEVGSTQSETSDSQFLTESPAEHSNTPISPEDDSASRVEEDPSVRLIFGGVPTSPLGQVSFDQVISFVESNELDSAIEEIERVTRTDMYDPCIANLLKIECFLQQGTPEAREAAWKLIASADTHLNPELYELQIVRLLLTSTRSERASILKGENLPADEQFSESVLLWTEARSGSKEPQMVEALRERTSTDSQSVADHIFLANAYFASKQQELALEELMTSRQLLRTTEPTSRSEAIQWIASQTKRDLEQKVESPIRRVVSQLNKTNP